MNLTFNILTTLSARIATLGLSLISSIVLARWLGPEGRVWRGFTGASDAWQFCIRKPIERKTVQTIDIGDRSDRRHG